MNILNKLLKREKIKADNKSITNKDNVNENSDDKVDEMFCIIEMNNYMLTEISKNDISTNSYKLAISKIASITPIAAPTISTLKIITEQNPTKSNNLYRVTNLGKNDSLKAMKNGKTFWGAIKTKENTSKMAKLKEVKPNDIMEIDPTIMMMSVALAGIEAELGEIKELSKKIFSFLEHDKEAEIESDLEILNKSINDFKYNLKNETYLSNNHKQVMDIKRTSNKNIVFYKKQLKDYLSKDKLFTTDSSMNSITEEIQKQFRYYRLSLYIYSFATFMEVLLLGNYNSDYLLSKKDELDELDNEYLDTFNNALDYIKKNANKSLESNVLSGLGSAGKTLGNLAEKIKVKNVDTWLNEKGNNLKHTSQDIKDNYITKFDEIKNTNTKVFTNQLDKVNSIYNKTKEIYFDKDNIYLEMN